MKMAKLNKMYENRICVITGAASGIGRALALALKARGAILALSDVNAEGLAETLKLAGGVNSNTILIDVLDVSDADAIMAYAPHVEKTLGKADYIFNVAGLTRVGNFDKTSLESMELVMNVNYWGVVRMCKAFLPQLKATQGGIINISSLFGLIGYPGQTHYCASKFAVRGFSETLAQEVEAFGIRVSCVHPGGVATGISRNAIVDALPDNIESQDALNKKFDAVAATSALDAALVILKGAAKGSRRILIGRDAVFLSYVQRLFPSGYTKFLAKLMR